MSDYSTWAANIRTPMLSGYGKTVTYRRKTAVGATNPALNPVDGAITVNTAALAGSAAVTLNAPSVGNWLLVAGDTFTIGSDTTVYSVTAQVVSASGKFTNVAISPPLAVAAAANAACTFAWLNDYQVQARVRNYAANLVNGTTVTTRDLRVIMATEDVNGRSVPLPRTVDGLIFDGVPRTIIQAVPQYAGDSPVSYDIQARV